MDKIKQSGNMEPLISTNPFDSFEEALKKRLHGPSARDHDYIRWLFVKYRDCETFV